METLYDEGDKNQSDIIIVETNFPHNSHMKLELVTFKWRSGGWFIANAFE